MLTGCVPGLRKDEVSTCLPAIPFLRPEEPARLTCALSCGGRVACGEGGRGGSEEQLRRLVSDPTLRRYAAERGVGLLRRIPRQPSGQQCQTTVNGQVEDGLAERVVAVACLVKVTKRLGKVAAAQRRQPEAVPGLGVFEFLAVGCEQRLGTGEVCACTPGETESEKDIGSMDQRSCLPYRVSRPAKIGQRAAQVLVCLAEAAHVQENVGSPHEHASGQTAVRGLHRSIQHGQPLPAAARPRERGPQGRLHVDLTVGLARCAGQPHPLPQLGDRAWEVSVVAQDDPDRLVSQ